MTVRFLCSVLTLAMPLASFAITGEFVLAERGKPAAICVVNRSPAAPSATYAACELTNYVQRLTGVELSVVAEPRNRRAVTIRRDDSLGADAFRLRVVGDGLEVVGGVRGVLYGVYELLETYGGVGWFSPERTVVTARETFAVPRNLDVTQRPAFSTREALWYEVFRDTDFATRLRLNGQYLRPEPRHGGRGPHFSGRLGNCHTFQVLVPMEKYGREHPEYFALVNGTRDTRKDAQLCLTNPDVLKLVTEGVLVEIRRAPEATYFGVSQNDNQLYCTCPTCAAVDKEEESHAGTMVRFVNAVAEAVERAFPDKIIETLAYQYTRKPPKKTRLRKNVMPCLCSIECDFAHPIATGKDRQTAAFRLDAAGWRSQTDQLYIWDYTTNYKHFPSVFPNFDVLQANLRFFRELGAISVFEQGANSGCGAEFETLKGWLLAKWLWNPDQPEGPLLDRFFAGFYGKAASPVRAYFDALRALPRPDGEFRLGIFQDPYSQQLVSDAFLGTADGLWQQAEDLVREEDPVVRRAVRMGRFSVDYMRFKRLKDRLLVPREFDLRRTQSSGGLESLKAIARRMDAVVKAEPKLRFAESKDAHAACLADIARVLTHEPKSFAPKTCVTLEEDRFEIHGKKRWCDVVDNAAAEKGSSLKIFPNNYQWCMMCDYPGGAFEPGETYRFRARAKFELPKDGPDGRVLEAGVWDRAASRGIASWTRRAKEIRADGWQWIDLGTFAVDTPQITLWLSGGRFDDKQHAANPALTALYIDKIELSRVQSSDNDHDRN